MFNSFFLCSMLQLHTRNPATVYTEWFVCNTFHSVRNKTNTTMWASS